MRTSPVLLVTGEPDAHITTAWPLGQETMPFVMTRTQRHVLLMNMSTSHDMRPDMATRATHGLQHPQQHGPMGRKNMPTS